MQNEIQENANPGSSRVSYVGIIGVLVGISMLLVIPGVSILPTKFLLVALITVGIAGYFLLSFIRDRRISFPLSFVYVSLLALPIAYILSGLIHGASSHSFFGLFALDSVSTIALLSLLGIVSFLFFTRVRAFSAFFASLLVAITAASALEIILLVVSKFSFPVRAFLSANPTLVGGWNDLGIFAGLGIILVLALGHAGALRGRLQMLTPVITAILLAMLVVINFTYVWQILALFSFLFILYHFSYGKGESVNGNAIGMATLVLAVSLASILSGGAIGAKTQNSLNVSFVEARPSIETTAGLAREVLTTSPVLGIGPNQFGSFWEAHKPIQVNLTPFWNTQFEAPFGFLPLAFFSAGVLGLFASLLLVVGVFTEIFRGGARSNRLYFVLTASLLFMLLALVFYVPGVLALALFFVLFGMMAAWNVAKESPVLSFGFSDNPSISFASLLGLSLMLLLSVGWLYAYGESFASLIYYNRAVAQGQAGNLGEAQASILSAIDLNPHPLYFQTLGEIYRTQGLMAAQNESLGEAERSEIVRGALQGMVQSANASIAYNEEGHQGQLDLYRALAQAGQFGVEGALEQAEVALNQAELLAPRNPAIKLEKARLSVMQENIPAARSHIQEAFQLKPNYTDAALLLSQIQVALGETEEALSLLEQAALGEPGNALIHFQLGLLRYNLEDWNGAARAFDRALVVNPGYANARYFFGLSIANLGLVDEAVEQFELLRTTNPDNQELALILSNLRAGRPALEGAQPPLDVAPEERETLPIEE